MSAPWQRTNTVLLVLVLLALLAIIAMLALRVEGGPLDPTNPPGPTDSVRLPGTPITGQTTISTPGHYYLTRDVTVTGGQIAITINASNVSLDLGGFTVGGNDAVGSWGIYVAGVQSDIRISNGTVKDFQFGLDAGDDTRVQIDGVNAVSNVRGFQIGHYQVLTDCHAMFNTETGIYVPGGESTIRDCTVIGNAGDGISLGPLTGNLVERSFVLGSGASIRDTGNFNTLGENVVGSIVLGNNGGAKVVDNVCISGAAIINPGGNTVGATDHANVAC
jgi:hypothetical protein